MDTDPSTAGGDSTRVTLSRREALVAGAGAVGVLAGCAGGPNRSLPDRPTGAWTHRAHDRRNTGSADISVPSRGTPAWDAGDAHVAAPVLSAGTVYSVASEATALDARDGSLRWSADLPGKADHAPALRGEALIVAAGDRLLALSRSTGDTVWSTPLGAIATGPVTASTDPSIVTVPVGDERLQAIDPATGDRLWRTAIQVPRQAAIGDDRVYVVGFGPENGDDGGILRAVSPRDGSRAWAVSIEQQGVAPVLAAEGLLVGEGGLLALRDPADGTRRATLGQFGDRLGLPPAVADGTAYVTSEDGTLSAVSVPDGTVEWRADVDAFTDTGVTVGREAVVVPGHDIPGADLPGIVALERADGAVRWTHPIEGFDVVVSTPGVLADGAVFYASNESVGIVALGDLPAPTE